MPLRGRDGGAVRAGTDHSLAYLYLLAQLDAQRPSTIGAGLKILEMLMALPAFRPPNGAKA